MKTAALLLVTACGLWSQPTGILSGTVIDAFSGQPIYGVDLALSEVGTGASPNLMTDAEGRFRYEALKPGRYLLRGSKAGYIGISYGAAAMGNPGRPIFISASQTTTIEFRLTPLSTIAGKVNDRKGEPVAGAVIALGFVDLYGAPPTMEPVPTVTDARGEFRIPNMPPGRYYVQALPPKAGTGLPAFYPSVGDFREAQPVTVTAGQEASGVAITLRESRVFSIRGKVGRSGVELWLLPRNDAGAMRFGKSYAQSIARLFAGYNTVAADGIFELRGVERGDYQLIVVATTGRAQESIGKADVRVTDRDVEGVVVPMDGFVQLSYRVQPDRELKDVSCFVVAYPTDADPSMIPIMGSTGPDRMFTHDRAIAGAYAMNARCKPDGWVVRSVRFEGAAGAPDPLDTGITITAGLRAAVFRLELTSDTGVVIVSASPGHWVTLIPDPPTPGRALLERSGWIDEEGRIVLHGIVPGDYRVYVWREATLGASAVNPAFLKRYENQSVPVSVRAAGQAQVEAKSVQP